MSEARDSRIYFASDLHLGAPDAAASRIRETVFLRWMDHIEERCEALYLVGDVFDFWFDYGRVVPKGSVRLLGRLAAWTDRGIPVHYFLGNHDMWMNGYLADEVGVTIHDDVLETEHHGHRLLIGHGDGKGPNDRSYKRLKKVFRHPLARRAFRWLHPDIGMALADRWSGRSRASSADEVFLGLHDEWLVAYCRRRLESARYDYLVFGHRHLPLQIDLDANSRYINLGDWITHRTYGELGPDGLVLRRWPDGDVLPVIDGTDSH